MHSREGSQSQALRRIVRVGMIEVVITKNAGKFELARVRMTNLTSSLDPSYGDYSLEFAVNTIDGVAIYQRSVYAFPRKEYNVLGLMKLALETLDEKELSLDGDPDGPDARHSSNLARGLERPL